MINEYINKLIDNLPIKPSESPQLIDLIFEGGFFNGSYLVGVGLFLKEMEKKKYIKIDRISGCSIGSFVSLLYVSDKMEYFSQLYENMILNLKKDYCFKNYKKIFEYLREILPENICELMNNKVFINYYNIKTCKSIVKHKYSSIDDIFETILKSCFAPFCINGDLCYKNKYIDGLFPYIFEKNKKQENIIN